jgi:hypothetical protein
VLLVHRCEKRVEINGEFIEKVAKLIHLKMLVRPENVRPYHVYVFLHVLSVLPPTDNSIAVNNNNENNNNNTVSAHTYHLLKHSFGLSI